MHSLAAYKTSSRKYIGILKLVNPYASNRCRSILMQLQKAIEEMNYAKGAKKGEVRLRGCQDLSPY